MSTRTIVVAGVLIAVAAVLGLTGLGYFPVPNVTDQATIMHVPAIIGGVLEGPLVGFLVSLVFGLESYVRFREIAPLAETAESTRILILLGGRLLIGILAALAYRGLRNVNQWLALVVAGVIGTAANTITVVGLAVLLGVFPPAIFAAIWPQFFFEATIAAIVTVAVVAAWRGLDTKGGSSV